MPFHTAREVIGEIIESGHWPTIAAAGEEAEKTTGAGATLKKAGPAAPEAVPTGFARLDVLTGGGLRPGELTVVAGLPGVGKTTLCHNIAGAAALDRGLPVAVFSLDMDGKEFILKLISSRAGVSLGDIYSGFILPEDRGPLTGAVAEVMASSVFIDDNTRNTIAGIRGQIAERIKECGFRLVVIDCVQLLSRGQKVLVEQKELSEICASLRGIAREFGVPVVAPYQLPHTWLSKKVVPHPSFLVREGFVGAIGADSVIFIYREGVCRKCDSPVELCVCPEPHTAHLVVAKKDGSSDTAEFVFSSRFVRFEVKEDAWWFAK